MSRLTLITDLAIIRANARVIRNKLPDSVKMLAVVKADAYGHGAVKVAKSLSGIADCFAVATVREGVELRNAGITPHILVLGACSDISDIKAGIENRLTLTAASLRDLKLINEAAPALKEHAFIALKIDTGMTRLGFRGPAKLDEALEYLRHSRSDDLIVSELYTHFADSENEEFTRLQRERFNSARIQVLRAGHLPVCHAAASEAMFNEENQFHMVRAGIALYGTGCHALKLLVCPAQKLVTHPVAFHTVSPGESVGYSRTFTAKRLSRIMTIPCGYGDGYPRILSGKSCVLVNGRRVKIVGNICMDMLMADVTGIPDISFSSKVTLMGEDGGERITPDELADLAETIPYEIMLGFSVRAERSWTDTERE